LTTRLIGLLLLALDVASCTTDEPHPWVPPQIDQTQTLARIGDTGHSMVCSAASDYVHSVYSSQLLVEAACTAHALQTTTNSTECAQVVAQCLHTLPPPVDEQLQRILNQASCEAAGVPTSGCDSPASELIACLDELGTMVSQIKLKVTCTAFGSPVPPDWWRIPSPPSCVALATRCRK
jgi:hypothetical protein